MGAAENRGAGEGATDRPPGLPFFLSFFLFAPQTGICGVCRTGVWLLGKVMRGSTTFRAMIHPSLGDPRPGSQPTTSAAGRETSRAENWNYAKGLSR